MMVLAVPVGGQSELDEPSLKLQGTAFFEQHIRPVLVERCYGCHAADAQRIAGGLLLDTQEGIRRGGDSGPAVIPGDLEGSLLWKAINPGGLEMPPEEALPGEVRENFRRWILIGAPDPRDGVPLQAEGALEALDIEAGRSWWSLRSPQADRSPWQEDDTWSRTDVDRYVYGALEARGLVPNRDAEPQIILRRLFFDLIGLPPSRSDTLAFSRAFRLDSRQALEDVVDRLLGDPRFGERWGRHWLDVARFAESAGRELNAVFPEAWRYRDWVIDAYQRDLPYDQFILAQMAGDLLEASSPSERAEQLVATGFLALGTKGLRERSRRQFQSDLVDEQIDVTTRGFLGLSVSCARCHDHKFEPIAQRDYYALAGIFASTTTYFGTLAVRPNRQASELIDLPRVSSEVGLPGLARPSGQGVGGREEMARLAEELSALERRAGELRRARRRARRQARRPGGSAEDLRVEAGEPLAAARRELRGIEHRIARLRQRLAALDDEGRPLAQCMGVLDAKRMRDVPLLVRGEIDRLGEVVPRGLIRVLDDPQHPFSIPSGSSGRLELARWIASEHNPLTARVYVNRIWLHLMGQGLVATPDDFGATGELPSHPELLDHLALRLIELGWSTKALIKEIVTSRCYSLSSALNAECVEIDPQNRLGWRAPARRLEAEALRDAILFVSGTLDPVRPRGSLVPFTSRQFVAEGFLERRDVFALPVRSVYLPVLRGVSTGMLETFDGADPSRSIGLRETTSTSLQALHLMNDPWIVEQSLSLARRLRREAEGLSAQVEHAFALVFGRDPTDPEESGAVELVHMLKSSFEERGRKRPGLLALGSFCQALFAAAEFRVLN